MRPPMPPVHLDGSARSRPRCSTCLVPGRPDMAFRRVRRLRREACLYDLDPTSQPSQSGLTLRPPQECLQRGRASTTQRAGFTLMLPVPRLNQLAWLAATRRLWPRTSDAVMNLPASLSTRTRHPLPASRPTDASPRTDCLSRTPRIEVTRSITHLWHALGYFVSMKCDIRPTRSFACVR